MATLALILCVALLAGYLTMPSSTRTVLALAGTPPATATQKAVATSTRAPTRAPTRVATHTPVAHAGQASPRRTPVPAPQPSADAAAQEAQIAAGLAIYQKMGCGGCHQLTAAKSVGVFGPSHDHLATTAERRIAAPDYEGRATTASGYIRESILSPDVYEAPEFRQYKYAMPTFSSIPDKDLDALVAFLMQQR